MLKRNSFIIIIFLFILFFVKCENKASPVKIDIDINLPQLSIPSFNISDIITKLFKMQEEVLQSLPQSNLNAYEEDFVFDDLSPSLDTGITGEQVMEERMSRLTPIELEKRRELNGRESQPTLLRDEVPRRIRSSQNRNRPRNPYRYDDSLIYQPKPEDNRGDLNQTEDDFNSEYSLDYELE